jgi:hypothetical protein
MSPTPREIRLTMVATVVAFSVMYVSMEYRRSGLFLIISPSQYTNKPRREPTIIMGTKNPIILPLLKPYRNIMG